MAENNSNAGSNQSTGSGSQGESEKSFVATAKEAIGGAVEATVEAVKERPVAAAAIAAGAAAAVGGAVYAATQRGGGEKQGGGNAKK